MRAIYVVRAVYGVKLSDLVIISRRKRQVPITVGGNVPVYNKDGFPITRMQYYTVYYLFGREYEDNRNSIASLTDYFKSVGLDIAHHDDYYWIEEDDIVGALLRPDSELKNNGGIETHPCGFTDKEVSEAKNRAIKNLTKIGLKNPQVRLYTILAVNGKNNGRVY